MEFTPSRHTSQSVTLGEELSKAKQKGTSAESALVKFLKRSFPLVERRALTGSQDQGDIAGTPNLVWEVKNQKTYKFSEWLKETKVETANANADFGFLIVKPNGIGLEKTGSWWAIMDMDQLVTLLEKAGYVDAEL